MLSLRAGATVALLAALLGCSTLSPRAAPHSAELEALWSAYGALPQHRALAIAGQLQRNQWVAGAAGGQETQADAEHEALLECARRRETRRLVDPCRLYAVGGEVVESRAGFSLPVRGR